jgi:mannose-1-phosphate guanylyltransferase
MAYVLARMARRAPDGVLGFFPADHHYTDIAALRRVVASAYRAARREQDLVFLLGAVPDRAESDYGWIEPGARLAARDLGIDQPLHEVSTFSEKPAEPLARELMGRGGLWNTFVLVGHINAFLDLFAATVPAICRAFAPVAAAVGLPHEAEVAADVYRRLPMVDASRDVLAKAPDRLAVLTLPGSGWTDLGHPSRVTSLMTPPWTGTTPSHMAAS